MGGTCGTLRGTGRGTGTADQSRGRSEQRGSQRGQSPLRRRAHSVPPVAQAVPLEYRVGNVPTAYAQPANALARAIEAAGSNAMVLPHNR